MSRYSQVQIAEANCQFNQSFSKLFWSRVDKNGPIPSHCPELGLCWIWTGKKDKDGYGKTTYKGKTFRTHRVAWEITNGSIEDGKLICHSCDNPSCCRPSHEFKGTVLDNNQDKVAKGRSCLGDKNGTRLHPETRPKGHNHYSRLYPEKMARGDRHGSKTHPEIVKRGDEHWTRQKPERILRGEQHAGARLNDSQVQEIKSQFATKTVTKASLARKYNVSWGTIRNVVLNRYWTHVA